MKYWQLPTGNVFSEARAVPWLETLVLAMDRNWSTLSSALVFGECPEPLCWNSDDTIFSYVLAGSAVIQWPRDGVLRHRQLSPGSICLFAGHESHEIRCKGRILTLNCACSPDLLGHAGRLQCGCSHHDYQITSKIAFRDSDLWQLGECLRNELTSPAPPNCALQNLIDLALCDYLLRTTATCHACPLCNSAHRAGPGLHCAHIFNGIQKAISYISANLEDVGLSIERIGAEIGLSPYHFARTFRAALGIPPHRYIVEQRLQRARELLEFSHKSAADVAFKCGFSSHSHLSSTFRRFLGMTPSTYRRSIQDKPLRRDELPNEAS